ncbi:hypothetical protein FOCC_FOCC016573 [Frankliniella occidentalis]|nr:hypothetical protein FOCC_FOCC016573 [Frankliniella occidentalis]
MSTAWTREGREQLETDIRRAVQAHVERLYSWVYILLFALVAWKTLTYATAHDQERKEGKMRLIEKSGDLFEATGSLAHCTSADFRVNAGVAYQFQMRYDRREELRQQQCGDSTRPQAETARISVPASTRQLKRGAAMTQRFFLAILPLALLGGQAEALASLRAFDCRNTIFNLTKVDLTSAQPCPPAEAYTAPTPRNIQIVQRKEFRALWVKTCRVRSTQRIYACHLGPVRYGTSNKLLYIHRHECERAHSDERAFSVLNHTIRAVKINQTTDHWVQLLGDVNRNGECWFGEYQVGIHHYPAVEVEASLTTLMRQMHVPLNTETSMVTLPDGTECNYGDRECNSEEYGKVVWETEPRAKCNVEYDTLYRGPANQTALGPGHAIITVESTHHLSALQVSLNVFTRVCGVAALTTEHANIYVVDWDGGETPFAPQNPLYPHNTNLKVYMDIKDFFISSTAHMRLEHLSHWAADQMCQLRRSDLLRALALGRENPQELLRHLTTEPGYTISVRGGVGYIMRCKETNVTTRASVTCHEHWPVRRDAEDLFLDPASLVLKEGPHNTPASSSALRHLAEVYNSDDEAVGASPPSPPTVHVPEEEGLDEYLDNLLREVEDFQDDDASSTSGPRPLVIDEDRPTSPGQHQRAATLLSGPAKAPLRRRQWTYGLPSARSPAGGARTLPAAHRTQDQTSEESGANPSRGKKKRQQQQTFRG